MTSPSEINAQTFALPHQEEKKNAYANLQMNYPCGNKKLIQKYYEGWAQDYDRDMTNLNYMTPTMLAQESAKVADLKSLESWRILDLGAGTGLIGIELRKQGFQGQIIACDYSEKMLEKALSRPGVYSSKIHHELTAISPLPVPDCSFDLVVCAGLAPGEIQPDCFQEIVRVIRRGGYLVHSRRANEKDYIGNLEANVKILTDKKVIKLIKRLKFQQYSWPVEKNDKKNEIVYAEVMVYHKL